jgi:hypothetical protein
MGLSNIKLHVLSERFPSWESFSRNAPPYSIAIEAMDDGPGHTRTHVNFDHHEGVVREATMSAAMQAYIAVRQGRLMHTWLKRQRPINVYVWNADQDVCLTAFVLEHHDLLERSQGSPQLRWIVQYNNKIDVCGGIYPVRLDELVENHFTWVFEPYREQRKRGRIAGDELLVTDTIEKVCGRLLDLLQGNAGISPITVFPEILYRSPFDYVIADEKGDPNSRLVMAAWGHTNIISLVCTRQSGRFTYTVVRGSPYDDGAFDVGNLIAAFQEAEDHPGKAIWGGSNTAAGSDSVLGSSLHWTQIRDIADRVMSEATATAVAL